eukprot:GSChrysophyteH2.ASY1.ANO1.1224.1 assembled CDS
MSNDRFSLAHLRELHRSLVLNKAVNDENEALVVESLRAMAEMVVYGDSKSEMLFDFFCEKNILALFLEIMWTESGCPIKVHIQILQTLGILVNSVRNDTSLYYLLSNNYVNEILIHPHDFANASDESLCDQYVSFMKSLSLKLDEKTVQFFFIEETGAFPLLEKAIDLLGAPEPMVRVAAQTTILNVYKVRDSRSREYALKEPILERLCESVTDLSYKKVDRIIHFIQDHSHLVWAIDTCNHLNRKLLKTVEIRLVDSLQAMQDWLYFIQDLLSMQIFHLKYKLVQHLMQHWIQPQLLDILRKPMPQNDDDDDGGVFAANANTKARNEKNGNAKDFDRSDAEEDHLQRVKISLLIIIQLLKILQDRLLQRAILVSMMHPMNAMARQNELRKKGRSTDDLNQVSLAGNSGVVNDSSKNCKRTALEEILNRTLYPTGTKPFDQTLDHLVLCVSLLMHRIFENAVKIGRYRDLNEDEGEVHFTGLNYELELLCSLSVIPPGITATAAATGEGASINVCTSNEDGALALSRISDVASSKAADEIDISIGLELSEPESSVSISTKVSEVKTKEEQEKEKRWEENETKRRQRNAKHSFVYGSGECSDGDLDSYLSGMALGLNLSAPLSRPVSASEGLGLAASASADSFLSEGGTYSASSNSSGQGQPSSRAVEYASNDMLLPLKDLLRLVRSNIDIDESATKTDSDSNNSRNSNILVDKLVDRLDNLLRGPVWTAPVDAPNAGNLSWNTVQTIAQSLFSYARFLCLAFKQLKDFVHEGEVRIAAAAALEQKTEADSAETGELKLQQQADKEKDDDDDDEEIEIEVDSAEMKEARAQARDFLPHIATELQSIFQRIREAHRSASQALLDEIGKPRDGNSSGRGDKQPNATNDTVTKNQEYQDNSAQTARESNAIKAVQFMNEELQRYRGCKFNRTANLLTDHAALYLTSSPELTHRLGSDCDGWPILHSDKLRRRIQMYIVIRALSGRLQDFQNYAINSMAMMFASESVSASSYSNSNNTTDDTAAGTGPGTNENRLRAVTESEPTLPRLGIDDLYCDIFDDSSLQPFHKLGHEDVALSALSVQSPPPGRFRGNDPSRTQSQPNNSNSTFSGVGPLAAGQLLQMKGRRFLEAKASYTPPLDAPELQNGTRSLTCTPKGAWRNSANSPTSGTSNNGGNNRTWGGIGAYFGFGGGNSNNNSGASTPTGSTDEKSSSRFSFGSKNDGNNNSQRIIFGGSNSPGKSAAIPTPQSLNVLFVQNPDFFVIVESSPKSIAEDQYCILVSLPLLNTEVLPDSKNKRKLKVVIRSYQKHICYMEPVGMLPPELSQDGFNTLSSMFTNDNEVLGGFGRSSSGNGASMSLLRGIYSDTPADEDNYIQESVVNCPSTLMPRPRARTWQLEIQFDSEKVCKLAGEHIQKRGKHLRDEKHEACRSLLHADAMM